MDTQSGQSSNSIMILEYHCSTSPRDKVIAHNTPHPLESVHARVADCIDRRIEITHSIILKLKHDFKNKFPQFIIVVPQQSTGIPI